MDEGTSRPSAFAALRLIFVPIADMDQRGRSGAMLRDARPSRCAKRKKKDSLCG
jgi:hypothetical protein